MAILVHGHRGARTLHPGNTLPAFAYAITAGADALELDVAVTRDDVPVVSHDLTLARRPIRGMTLAELAGRLPTLDEVLALADRGHFLFNIEIKSQPERPKLAPPPDLLAELVRRAIHARRLEQRVIVQSFDFRVLRALRKLTPEIRLAALYVGPPRSLVAIARRAGTSIVAPHHALATRRKVRAAHAAGLEVIVWTANTPRQWKRLAAAQVDAIITDDPAGLARYLRERGLRQ